jgi:hypothetical protein
MNSGRSRPVPWPAALASGLQALATPSMTEGWLGGAIGKRVEADGSCGDLLADGFFCVGREGFRWPVELTRSVPVV